MSPSVKETPQELFFNFVQNKGDAVLLPSLPIVAQTPNVPFFPFVQEEGNAIIIKRNIRGTLV